MDPAVIKALSISIAPGLLMALGWWMSLRLRENHSRVGPVILALCVIVSHCVLYQQLLPGPQSLTWFPTLAAAACIAGLLRDNVPSRATHWIAQLVVLLAAGWLFTPASFTDGPRAVSISVLVIGGFFIVAGLGALARLGRGPATPAAGCFWITAVSIFAMLLRSSQTDAYPAVALASALGSATAIALLRPALNISAGTMTTLGLIGCGNIYRAQMLGEGVPWHSALVIPVLALTALIPVGATTVFRSRTPRFQAIAAVSAAGVLSLAAIATCLILAPPPLD